MALEQALTQAIADAVTLALTEQLAPVIRQLQSLQAPAPDPLTADPLFTRKEAAEYLKCSPITLAIWYSEGRGPRLLHINKAVRYRKSELDEYLAANIGLVGRKGRPPKQAHLRETNHPHAERGTAA